MIPLCSPVELLMSSRRLRQCSIAAGYSVVMWLLLLVVTWQEFDHCDCSHSSWKTEWMKATTSRTKKQQCLPERTTSGDVKRRSKSESGNQRSINIPDTNFPWPSWNCCHMMTSNRVIWWLYLQQYNANEGVGRHQKCHRRTQWIRRGILNFIYLLPIRCFFNSVEKRLPDD